VARNVKNLLLVLTTSGTSERALDFAVEAAKMEGANLIALYLLETELAREVFDRFSDIGFIGDRPSMELTEAIMKDYRQRGYEELGRVQVKAMEEGVGYEPLMEQGDYIEKVLEVIRDRNIDVAVVVRRKPSALLRYFSRSVADELAERAPCKVHVFEE
jgi:nucleotide-binding universal stress UspA family protein